MVGGRGPGVHLATVGSTGTRGFDDRRGEPPRGEWTLPEAHNAWEAPTTPGYMARGRSRATRAHGVWSLPCDPVTWRVVAPVWPGGREALPPAPPRAPA